MIPLAQFLLHHVWVDSMLIQMEIVFQMSVYLKLLQLVMELLYENVLQVKFQMAKEGVLQEHILNHQFHNAPLDSFWMTMVHVKQINQFQLLLILQLVLMD